MSTPSIESSSDTRSPAFEPDPEIIGNVEGNRKLAEADAEAARRYLREREDDGA